MSLALRSPLGRVWVQPGGPGYPSYMLSCHDAGDLTEPFGGYELLRCFRSDGSGWDIITATESPPDPVTFSLTNLMMIERDWMEQVRCPFTLYALWRDCGDAGLLNNYVRGQILQRARRTQRVYADGIKREEDTAATHAVELEAIPPLLDVDSLTVGRIATALALAWNDVIVNGERQCIGDCGLTYNEGQYGLAASDSAVGPATADVPLSTDEGESWAAAAADPFGAGFHIMSATWFFIDRNTRRYVVGREGTGAVQGQTAYTDDNGATWTVTSMGGAAVGHGPTYGHSLFNLGKDFVWCASADGYIYKSTNGAQSWVAKESGSIAVTDYKGIHFADRLYGVAVTAAGVVAVTSDGGETWEAAGVIDAGAAGNLCCWRFDKNRILVGDDAGQLWTSYDGGATWTEITGWVGSGVGDVRSLDFVNEYQGFMAYNTVAPLGTVLYTFDGGYTWIALDTPANSGLNSVRAATARLAFAVGEANAATAFIAKVEAPLA